MTVSQVFQEFTFPGRGGAVSILINSLFEFDVSISECLVVDNTANTAGNGVLLVFTGHSSHTATIDGTMFVRNTGSLTGALTLGYFEGTTNGMLIQLNVRNCRFEGNSASFGGGVFLYAGSELVSSNRALYLK